MGKYEELREKHPVFVYKAYYVNETRDSVEIGYEFSIPGLAEFRPSWSFHKPEGFTVNGDLNFDRLAFSLGMADCFLSYAPLNSALCAENSTRSRSGGGRSCGTWDWENSSL